MPRALWVFALISLSGAGLAQQTDSDPADSAAEPPAADAAAAPADTAESSIESGGGVKSMLGMSILGNQEAPKSLVIVPWKSSEIGDGVGVSRALDTRIRPVDKDVFARELRYYQLRASDGQ